MLNQAFQVIKNENRIHSNVQLLIITGSTANSVIPVTHQSCVKSAIKVRRKMKRLTTMRGIS